MRKTSALLLLVCLAGRATEKVAGPLHFSEVYLCFAEEHAADLVSGFGHTFVCLPEMPVKSADELLASPSVNFAADTSGTGEGIWKARYRVRPCYELIRANNFFQQRDVYFIRLKLNESERQRLALSLNDRLDRPFSYDFLRNNCGANLTEWILTSTGHADKVPSPLFYITPRESVQRVIDVVGAEGILFSRSSANRVTQRASALGPAAAEQARAAVRDPSLTARITDPQLRLEVIRLNESRVDPDKYRELQVLRRTTLEGPGGIEAAKALTNHPDNELVTTSAWTRTEEGPSVSVGTISDTDGHIGLRLGWEAGLRDVDTAPQNNESRRIAHLLSIEIDRLSDTYRTRFILAGMHNERNLPGIFGGGSSGFEAGYIDRVNAEGTHGIHLESWSGLAARWGESTWTGIRVIARADDIQNDTRLRLLPAITASTRVGPISVSGILISAQGELGYRIDASLHEAPSTLSLSLERAPEGKQRLLASLSRRF